MQLKKDLKWLLATRSPSLVRNRYRKFNGTTSSLQWHGREVTYRPGTNDPNIIYNVLFKTRPREEYAVPATVKPLTILDIGGHIGSAALFFAMRYPDAHVYSFEPVNDNFELLKKNTQGLRNVTAVNLGLGNEDRTLKVRAATPGNLASFSVNSTDTSSGPEREIVIRNAGRCLQELSIDKVDLIKLDAEGAEMEIIEALPEEILGNAQWITGELHGENCFDVLQLLSRWYELGVNKKYSQQVFMFEGWNRRRDNLCHE